ncbi:hypothetical protein MLD38_035948 [Melastoma candidum]|uniref:Uncharacterized protein n=1 Tax=Melastoma candidum TaxID=119954 RepID=A0ACB9LI18_9MYRT|nr:hypothetical protein MLD38_035948 [Melastoma candidum]
MEDVRWQMHDTAFSSSSSSLPSYPTSPVVHEEESGHQQLSARLKSRKRLSKQLSMRETQRDIVWEKRRRQMQRQGHKFRNGGHEPDPDVVTDEDLDELRGCIELGFGFKEGEEGQRLCGTLPALDLYFAVNRQLSPSPVSTPQNIRSSSSPSLLGGSTSLESPRSDSDSWKIVSPGDNPQQVKTRLRHWAQAVACAVRQSF